jgi:trans-2,3-dihydro-3-hydroxyanthranilate isomerase
VTSVRYKIVDVFTDRPLAGNALCVVLDPVPESIMQSIARETNLSETTFPTVTSDHAYDVRIFTPQVELPFAGHPTLGTAWVLGPGTWTQTSPGASVVVEADETGAQVTQPEPVITPAASRGIPGEVGTWIAEAGGVRHLIVATDAPIETLDPTTMRATDATTFAVMRRRTDTELHVRVFVPGAGVPEDPGTGSVAGPIGVIAGRLWSMGPAITIKQGAEIGRPSTIHVDISTATPVVGGNVAAAAEGVFTVL